MTTSTPHSTSKSSSACRCSQDCGCCTRKALAAAAAAPAVEAAAATVPEPAAPGFFGRRPWIWIFVAFGIMFSAWTVMFTLAIKNQPEAVELVFRNSPSAH